jgi:hypothetical protein
MEVKQKLDQSIEDLDKKTYDKIFSTLSNSRRRYILNYMKYNDEIISTGDLAAQLAAWENEIPVEEVNNKQRKRCYTALRQTHLPVMSESGLLTYDVGRGIVIPSERIKNVDFYLETSPHQDIPWNLYYLLLSVFSVALAIAVALNIYPFTLLAPVGWMLLSACFFFVSALFHVYEARKQRFGEDELPPSLRHS